MHSYLDAQNEYFGKTNREIFAEERERVLDILNDPEQMKDRRNEGHEWSLALYNDILNEETIDFMMQTTMKSIVNKAKMSQSLSTAHVIQNAECN